MGSLPGLSWTFARCLIARPIRPTTTSTAPASISQCGNSNHPIAVLTVSNLLPRLQPELDQAADGFRARWLIVPLGRHACLGLRGHFGASGLLGQYFDLVKIQFFASVSVSKSPI
jgi:hypothetical protein